MLRRSTYGTRAQWLLNLIGLAIIVYATVRLIQTLWQGKLGDLERGLVLPLWLNLALIPCTLLIGVWAAYHDAFIRLQIGADPTPHSLRRAKRALVREVRFHVHALGKFGPPWPYRFSKAETAAEARSVARALVAAREGRPEDAG